ncbi:MAG: hypothetical protein ACXWK4_04810, partial [Myxococcaceae bacterium]
MVAIEGAGVYGNELIDLATEYLAYPIPYDLPVCASTIKSGRTLLQIIPAPFREQPVSRRTPRLVGDHDIALPIQNRDLGRQKVKGLKLVHGATRHTAGIRARSQSAASIPGPHQRHANKINQYRPV